MPIRHGAFSAKQELLRPTLRSAVTVPAAAVPVAAPAPAPVERRSFLTGGLAALGLGAIEKRPVVINDSIAIRSMCYVTLSYDHRVVDGAVAHQFLHKVKETLENWSEPVL